MTQKERDTQGFFQHAETPIDAIPYIYLASPFSHPDPKMRKRTGRGDSENHCAAYC